MKIYFIHLQNANRNTRCQSELVEDVCLELKALRQAQCDSG